MGNPDVNQQYDCSLVFLHYIHRWGLKNEFSLILI